MVFWLLAAAMCVGGAALLWRTALRPLLSMFHALSGTVLSYKDGDYSFGLHWPRNDEVGDLVDAHNALGEVLREQRLELVRRELLLDEGPDRAPERLVVVGEGLEAGHGPTSRAWPP